MKTTMLHENSSRSEERGARFQRRDAAQSRRQPSGFSLIELLTVIAIIGILAAILIPVANKVREQALGVKCMSNVSSITLAYMTYAQENETFPATGNFVEGDWGEYFWTHRLLDFLDLPYQDTYINNRQQYPFDGQVLWCPAEDRHHSISDYGPSDTVIPHSRPPPYVERVLDPSRTVLIGEGRRNDGGGTWWLKSQDFLPSAAEGRDGPLPPRHGDHGYFGFVDGHVEKIGRERIRNERTSLFTGPYDSGNPIYQ